MDIQNNINFKRVLITVGFIAVFFSGLVFADGYDDAVEFFKAGDYSRAIDEFGKFEQDSNDLIDSVCTANMLGQCYRVLGDYDKAIEAFGKVEMFAGRIKGDELVDKLCCLGLMACGEMFEQMEMFDDAVKEYDKVSKECGNYYGIAMDRKCGLLYRLGKFEEYQRAVDELMEKDGSYERIGMVGFENLFAKYLQRSSGGKINYQSYSIGSIAAGIGKVKASRKSKSVEKLIDDANAVVSEYSGSGYEIVMRYHFATLLDSAGKKDLAAKEFGKIIDWPLEGSAGIFADVKNYAKVQLANLLIEKKDYERARAVINSVAGSGDGYLDNVVVQVRKSIATLKREEAGNEDD